MENTDHYQPKVYFNGVSMMNWHAYDDVVDDDDIVKGHVGDANDEGDDDEDDDDIHDEKKRRWGRWGFPSEEIGVLTSSAPLELMPLDLSLRSNLFV